MSRSKAHKPYARFHNDRWRKPFVEGAPIRISASSVRATNRWGFYVAR